MDEIPFDQAAARRGRSMSVEPVRAEEPAPPAQTGWDRLWSFTPLVLLTVVNVVRAIRGETGGWLLVLAAGWVIVLAIETLRRRRPPRPRPWVVVEADGIRRSKEPEWIAFADLARVDRQERWPNLALHRDGAKVVRLLPWLAARDDEAASAVATTVLERAAAAGVDTTQQPLALWHPVLGEVDWDRAILPPSRWSRRRSSSSS